MEEDIDARCGDHLLQEVGAELQIVGAAVGAWIVVFDEAVLAEGGDEAGEGVVDALAVAAEAGDPAGGALAAEDVGGLDYGDGGIECPGRQGREGTGHAAAEDEGVDGFGDGHGILLYAFCPQGSRETLFAGARGRGGGRR